MTLPDYGGTLWSNNKVSIAFAFEPCLIAIIPLEIYWFHNLRRQPVFRLRIAVLNFWIALTIKRSK